MVVDIKWSKTNQYRNQDLIPPLIPAKNREICLVFWINLLHQRFPTNDKNAPLFGYRKRCHDVFTPLSADILANKYKNWIKATGRAADTFTLHGLRRGGTNHTLTVGLCGEEIKLMGNWASNVYLQNIDLILERHVTNMVKFVDEMDRVLDQNDAWDHEQQFLV